MKIEDLSPTEYWELYERIKNLFDSRGIVLTNEQIESKMKSYLKENEPNE